MLVALPLQRSATQTHWTQLLAGFRLETTNNAGVVLILVMISRVYINRNKVLPQTRQFIAESRSIRDADASIGSVTSLMITMITRVLLVIVSLGVMWVPFRLDVPEIDLNNLLLPGGEYDPSLIEMMFGHVLTLPFAGFGG